ncbi:unnamed protein product [Gordionus sp. m RMFG-2023]
MKQCSEVKYDRASILASYYTKRKRVQESVCVYAFFVLIIYNAFCLLVKFQFVYLHRIIISIILASLLADFGSGIIHWAFDTWGNMDSTFGKAFIRSFRQHHIDPTSITKHDFIETNGDNCALTIPLLFYLALKSFPGQKSSDYHSYGQDFFLLIISLYAALTNQIHKWSHTYHGLPKLVVILQRFKIILPPSHHRTHHIMPHDCYYCITTGWLNRPLEFMKFDY